jgi:hypothetical protein
MGLDVGAWTPRSQRPIDKLRAAVRAVEDQGLRICLDCDHGVGRHAVTGGWVADTPYRPRRVSLAGAVCLVLQPAQGLVVEEAAAAALDVAWEWFLGALDGWQADPYGQASALVGASREHYRDGLRAGGVLFAELTIECSACGARRYHQDPKCGACAAA